MKGFFLLFISFGLFLNGEIVDIKYMSEINKHLNEDTLIVFDLDDTIIEMPREVGSNRWFKHRMKRYEKLGLSPADALEKALDEWMSVQCISEAKLVEPYTAALIKDLQDKGRVVIGLTTRGLGLATRSIHQLKALHVHLERTSPTKEEIFFQNKEACLFRQGILFTAGSHKGEALKKLLKELNYQAKRVVFVNDKLSHLKPVEEFCEKAKIPFVGLRYGFTDEKVKNFRSDVADLQFEKFKRILSDQEAEIALRGEE